MWMDRSIFLYREDEIRIQFLHLKASPFVMGSPVCVGWGVVICIDILYGLKYLLLLQTG